MAPSSSNAWCNREDNLSKFDIDIFETQLLVVDAQQKRLNAEVAKLRHMFSHLLSGPPSSEPRHQHSNLHPASPTIAAVSSGDSAPSSTPRVCNRPGCKQHIPSSDPTRDRYLQDKLKRGEWSPRKICSSCKTKDKLALAATKKNAKSIVARQAASSSSAIVAQPAIEPPMAQSSSATIALAAAATKSLKSIVRPHDSSSSAVFVPLSSSSVAQPLPTTAPSSSCSAAQPVTTHPAAIVSSPALTANSLRRQTKKSATRATPSPIAPLKTAPSPALKPSPKVSCYADFFEPCDTCGGCSDDDSGSCPYCNIPLKFSPFCAACGADHDGVSPCHSCTSRLSFLPDLPPPPNFVRYLATDLTQRLGIRSAAAYPGQQTGGIVIPREILPFTSSSMIEHTHIDGKSYHMTFYKLADGRGWIHDFDIRKPGSPSITRGWADPDFTTLVPTRRTHDLPATANSTSSSPPLSR